jgi:gliding motility-associated-like protein
MAFMRICLKNSFRHLIFFLLTCVLFYSKTYSQSCPYTNVSSYSWPNHKVWFFGNGVIADFTNGAPIFSNLPIVDSFDPPTSYEGTAAVSNEEGKLLWVSNGRRVWNADGDDIHGDFTTGNEGDKLNGSAVQGILVTRHPLNPNLYHVFCTDDVIDSDPANEGLDYFKADSNGIIIGTKTTIQTGRTFEGLTATKHANGFDIWVMAQDFTTGYYNAYLIDCNGLNIGDSKLNQDMGIDLIGLVNFTRGALEFSWDGGKMAQGHPAFSPVGDQEVSLYDFDNSTGLLSNPIHFSSTIDTDEPYDIEFSIDQSKLYFTTRLGKIGYYDISSGIQATMTNSRKFIYSFPTHSNGSESGLETGADGKIYINNSRSPDLYVVSGESAEKVAVGSSLYGTLGLPNMYIPPADSVKIQPLVGANDCSAINLETIWKCKSSTAENTLNYEDAYSVALTGAYSCPTCVIDSRTGAFTVPGPGTYEVHFKICELKDTLIFNVISCTCDARVGGASPICPGETFNLDNIVEGTSGQGLWTVDSVPTGTGIDAVIDDTGLDTLFDASDLNTTPGIYKLMFRVDDTCEDSVYIEVKTPPSVDVTEIGPFCDDSVKTTVVAIPTPGGDVTNAVWQYADLPSIPAGLPYEFDPAIFGTGVHRIKYSVDSLGCSGEDSIKVLVKERPHPEIKPAGPFCADVNEYQLELVDVAVDSGVWSGESNIDGKFYPSTSLDGDHDVFYTIHGLCGNDTTIKIHVDPVKDATITSSNDTLNICAFDPNPTFTVSQDGGSWIDDAGTPQVGVIQTTTDIEFDLNILGAGLTNEMFVYVQGDPCGDKDTIWLTTTDKLDASITQVGPYCDSDNPVALVVVDEGGTFSGDGITDINAGIFSPIIAKDGMHRVTYTIPGNCGDNKFIDIEVLRTPDPSITNSVIEFCEEHGDVTMTSTETGGTWRAVNSDNGGLNAGTGVFNTVTSSHGGYEIEYGFTGQCPAYDTITLNVDEMPIITFTTSDGLLVCEDDAPFQVEAGSNPSNSTLTWLQGTSASGEFTPAGNLYFNTILLEAENGLCSTDSSIIIGVLPLPNAQFASPPYFCIDDIAQPMLPVEAGGEWTSSATGAIDINTSIFDPAIAGAGVHTVTYKIPGQCEVTYSADISVIAPPDPTITNPGDFCEGDSEFILEAASIGGFWSGDVNFDGSFDPTVNGDYTVRYETGNECKDFDEITFTVNVVPETKFIGTGNGCVPLEVSFSDASGVLPAQSTWFFDGKDSTNSIGIVSHVFDLAGCYDVTLKNEYPNGCYSEHTEEAACAFALPEANFVWEPRILDVSSNTVTLFSEASSDVVFVEWDFLDSIGVFTHEMIGSSRVTDINPIVKFVSNIDSGGIVNVSQTVVNSDGCRDSITMPIIVLDKFSVYIPNAFTPNDDGLNETFYPEGRNLVFGENYAFRIYNRWGTLIWISKVPGQAWDGRITELVPTSGDIAQIDVYVWRLDVIDPYTKDKIIKVGQVSLVK